MLYLTYMTKVNTNKTLLSSGHFLVNKKPEIKQITNKNQVGISTVLKEFLVQFPDTENALRFPNETNKKAKPFVQWVGGKREMIPQYQTYLPVNYDYYFEPFLGGGAMFFYLEPKKAYLADSNNELIKAYEGVRDNVEGVIDLLKLLKAKHSESLYLAVRNLDRVYDILSNFNNYEIAARLIYLNQTGFNGVYRVNQKGQFNVPIGSSLNRLICDESTLRKAAEVLRDAVIKCIDFEHLSEEANKNDFVYLDPPYHPISKYSDFTRYTKEKFYEEDQIRLKKAVDSLSKKGCKVMLSNSDCEFINNLYSDYKKIKVSSSRSLNSKVDKRGKVSELLIMNY